MKDTEIDDNNNNLDEEDEEEKEAVGIEFTEQKVDSENDENVIDFRWSSIRGKEEENIAKDNLIESLHKQADEENFPNRLTVELYDYYDIIPKEEKNKKILVHSKFSVIIFDIKFFV